MSTTSSPELSWEQKMRAQEAKLEKAHSNEARAAIGTVMQAYATMALADEIREIIYLARRGELFQ